MSHTWFYCIALDCRYCPCITCNASRRVRTHPELIARDGITRRYLFVGNGENADVATYHSSNELALFWRVKASSGCDQLISAFLVFGTTLERWKRAHDRYIFGGYGQVPPKRQSLRRLVSSLLKSEKTWYRMCLVLDTINSCDRTLWKYFTNVADSPNFLLSLVSEAHWTETGWASQTASFPFTDNTKS